MFPTICHQMPSTSIHCYLLPSTVFHCHLLPTTEIHYHLLPSTAHRFHIQRNPGGRLNFPHMAYYEGTVDENRGREKMHFGLKLYEIQAYISWKKNFFPTGSGVGGQASKRMNAAKCASEANWAEQANE